MQGPYLDGLFVFLVVLPMVVKSRVTRPQVLCLYDACRKSMMTWYCSKVRHDLAWIEISASVLIGDLLFP
jgi:hypothetical protein